MTSVSVPSGSRSGSRGAGLAEAAATAVDYADDLILGAVRDTHRAVARRVFVRPPVHDTISDAVYAGLGAAFRATSSGLRALERRGIGPRLEETARGRRVNAVVNGLIGDRLVQDGSMMAIEMTVRSEGADVPRAALREHFAGAGETMVVFLHGLMEDEAIWRTDSGTTRAPYGQRLAAEEGWTPVEVRFNSGIPLAENGVALASLLDDLVAAWPRPARRIALVGHSMGGLVIRAACAVTTDSREAWAAKVTDVVTLGTPHLGAPLEQVVNLGARALGVLPESAPFGRILEYRSSGILDLRRGLARDLQNLPRARYHLVAATLSGSTRHPVAQTLGDLLVRYPSAVGTPRRGPGLFPDADVLHVPNTDHFQLANHDDVYAALRGWLADRPQENTA